jgi:hypothetical protein
MRPRHAGPAIAGDSGELLFTQPDTHPPIVFRAQADGSGQVSLGTKLPRNQKLEVAEARSRICSILAKLRTGKEGEAIAAAARAKNGSTQVVDAQADKLSAEIGNDIRKTMAPLARKGLFRNMLLGTTTTVTPGEEAETFASIRARYMGRKYSIDGQVYTKSRSSFSGEMQIAYLVTQTGGLLRIRQSDSLNMINVSIKCILASDQAKLFLTLAEGDFVKLAGTVSEIDSQGMELSGCRQAQ